VHTSEFKSSSWLGPIVVSALVAALVVTAAERIRRRNTAIHLALRGDSLGSTGAVSPGSPCGSRHLPIQSADLRAAANNADVVDQTVYRA